GVGRHGVWVFLIVIMPIFGFSLWSSMWKPSGLTTLAWTLGWVIGSGRVALRWPGFAWPGLCAAMLLIWELWTLRYGQTAWQSQFVFMFAVLYLLAALTGALAGNLIAVWRIRRLRGQSQEQPGPPGKL
ncbi:MAG: hypothetical protein KC442_12130, partial [Thermomicrobiales bacterium]|nr:hypothetical protein [Thermomicrobiales bacterium]